MATSERLAAEGKKETEISRSANYFSTIRIYYSTIPVSVSVLLESELKFRLEVKSDNSRRSALAVHPVGTFDLIATTHLTSTALLAYAGNHVMTIGRQI